jgi:hypothetical protein
MKRALPLVAFALAVVLPAAARAQGRSRPPLPKPPVLITGLGLGPAFPYCDDCNSKIGAGGRAFVTLPIVLPFGIGLSTEHEEFRLGHFGNSGYTFTGFDLILSTGFGLTWQVEVLFAIGEGHSDSANPAGDDSGGGGEFGLRVSRRLAGRTRLGVTGTVSGMATRAVPQCPSAGCEPPPTADFVSGATLITVDFAFEIGPKTPEK